MLPGLSSEVTSPKDFYEVSKNFFSDPKLSSDTWSLQIVGLVKQPRTLGYDDLLKLPAIERYETLQCISNEVGGDLIGNAAWKGVRLSDLLAASNPDYALHQGRLYRRGWLHRFDSVYPSDEPGEPSGLLDGR